MEDTRLLEELCAEFLPVVARLAESGDYSVAVNGSHSKGTSDRNSDFDFSVYYDKPVDSEIMRAVITQWNGLAAKWKEKGVIVDGIFPRTYAEVEEQMDAWLSGKGSGISYVWTIWGYHILTEIQNQLILVDTGGRAGKWKERLSVYPEALKKSIMDKHVMSLRYWRSDYHYRNKVGRKDVVFLASLTARLVQDMMQVIYALNETYYPGDGSNLKYTQNFAIKPDDFESRITRLFMVSEEADAWRLQYEGCISLIDDTLALADEFYYQNCNQKYRS